MVKSKRKYVRPEFKPPNPGSSTRRNIEKKYFFRRLPPSRFLAKTLELKKIFHKKLI